MGRSSRDIAGYRLVAGLGEGGMARVYLALSKKAAGFSKLVVLKVLRSSATADPELRRMFFDEARVAALLNHPNVVQTYEAGDEDGRLFLAMEYLEGKSLSALRAARAPRELPLDIHLRIIADMLEGLHYAHGLADVDGSPLDIIHRDVSPQNVLVTFAGQSKVVDFGIAKVAGSPLTQAGVIKGKVGYMAPEQIHNKETDRRADVFAAGVMIWEAIAKRRLVLRGEPEAVSLARRMNGEDPSIRTVAPAGTPEELLAICEKAMSAQPAQRHATALDLHDALDRFLRRTTDPDSKSVAEYLEAAFGAERRETRAFVEEQLRTSDDSSPLIDVAKHRNVALTIAATPAALPDAFPDIPSSAPEMEAERDRRSASTGAAQVADVVHEAERSRSARMKFAIGGGVAVAVLIVGLTAAFGRSSSTPAAAIAPPAASSATTTASSASPTVKLVVRTTPEGATLLVNDEVQQMPYQGKLARGTSVHLTARAPGFFDYDRTVTVDEDTTLDVGLSRAAPASSGGRTDGGLGPEKKARKRAIDDGDPYRR